MPNMSLKSMVVIYLIDAEYFFILKARGNNYFHTIFLYPMQMYASITLVLRKVCTLLNHIGHLI